MLDLACTPTVPRPSTQAVDCVVQACNGDIRSAVNTIPWLVNDSENAQGSGMFVKSGNKGLSRIEGKSKANDALSAALWGVYLRLWTRIWLA